MDSLALTDLKRMVNSIEHESNNEAKVIKLEALQEYERIKESSLAEGRASILEKYNTRLEGINRSKIQAEEALRKEVRIRIQFLKEKVCKKLISHVENALKGESKETNVSSFEINDRLICETFEHIKSNEKESYYVFCTNKDRIKLENYISKLGNGKIFTVRSLPEDALGGIIICDIEGIIFYDNSYKTRLDILKSRHLNVINKLLF